MSLRVLKTHWHVVTR